MSDTIDCIPFTQYLRPYGKKSQELFPIPEGWEEKDKQAARDLVLNEKVFFEAEILTTGKVAFYVQHKDIPDEDWLIEICENGPPCLDAVLHLVRTAKDAIQEVTPLL